MSLRTYLPKLRELADSEGIDSRLLEADLRRTLDNLAMGTGGDAGEADLLRVFVRLAQIGGSQPGGFSQQMLKTTADRCQRECSAGVFDDVKHVLQACGLQDVLDAIAHNASQSAVDAAILQTLEERREESVASQGQGVLETLQGMLQGAGSPTKAPFLWAAAGVAVAIAALARLYYSAKKSQRDAEAERITAVTEWVLQDFEAATWNSPYGFKSVMGIYTRVMEALGLRTAELVVTRLSELRDPDADIEALAKMVAKETVDEAGGEAHVQHARATEKRRLLRRLRDAMQEGDTGALEDEFALLMQPLEKQREAMRRALPSSKIMRVFRQPLRYGVRIQQLLRRK